MSAAVNPATLRPTAVDVLSDVYLRRKDILVRYDLMLVKQRLVKSALVELGRCFLTTLINAMNVVFRS